MTPGSARGLQHTVRTVRRQQGEREQKTGERQGGLGNRPSSSSMAADQGCTACVHTAIHRRPMCGTRPVKARTTTCRATARRCALTAGYGVCSSDSFAQRELRAVLQLYNCVPTLRSWIRPSDLPRAQCVCGWSRNARFTLATLRAMVMRCTASLLSLLLLGVSLHIHVTSARTPPERFDSVQCGSVIKLRHEQSGTLLHSHEVTWGSGSKQQSVTTTASGLKHEGDPNSLWIVRAAGEASVRTCHGTGRCIAVQCCCVLCRPSDLCSRPACYFRV